MNTNDDGLESEVRDAMDALRELEDDLFDATGGRTSPSVVRTFVASEEGDEDLADELEVLGQHDYEASLQTSEGSHVHVGRLLLTGGLSILAGRSGIRSQGRVTVTFQRRIEADLPTSQAGTSPSDLVGSLERLAALRDAGHLTNAEFDAAKASILGGR